MLFTTSASRLFQVSLVSTAVLAFPQGYGNGYGQGYGGHSSAKNIYLQTNDAENALVAIPVNPRDGTLSGGVKVSTGGRGGNTAVNGTSTPSVPDALGSQGSVTVEGNNIFVVNAGSDSLSVFEASSWHNAEPRLLQTVKLPGDFPVTVAVSCKHNLVCVGFSGAKAGVSCLSYSWRGLGQAGPLHTFPLDQTTPPSSIGDLLGQVFFSDDEEHLYATARGKTGFFASLPTSSLLGSSGSSATAYSLEGKSVTLFDGVSIPRTNNVFVSDPTVGARILAVNQQTQIATVEKTVNITSQKAVCWIALDAQTGKTYIDDAGRRELYELDSYSGAVTAQLSYSNSAQGGFDLVAAGGYVYILYAGKGKFEGSISVISTHGQKGGLELVQTFSLEPLGVTPDAVGLAIGY